MTNPFSIPFAPPETRVPATGTSGLDHETQVRVPEEVDLPLPRDTVSEITVPSSINGRDLSRGKP